MSVRSRCALRRWNDHNIHGHGHPGIVGSVCEAELVVVVFDAELWIWDARRADSWTFVSLPVEASRDIRNRAAAAPRRGFGSMRVRVTVGDSTWTTSIFPDSARGSYVLPIKRAVRTAEDLDAGDVATVTVELIDL
jgi:hypothetical protein